MDDMNDLGSYAQGSRCYEQLRAMDPMNDIGLSIEGSKYYE